MNAERLHLILRAVQIELADKTFIPTLQQLVTSLQNQVNQPAQTGYQQNVAQSLASLNATLSAAPSNSFSPAWKQVLNEIGASEFLGAALDARLREIFARNQITPSAALQELQQISQTINQLKSAVDQVVSGFAFLKISADGLAPGECEVGVVIPRKSVDNKLDPLADELHELNIMLGDFEEIATGKRDGFSIRTVSSTDFAFFVGMAPKVAALLAVTVERLVQLYKRLLEIRRIQKELKEQGVPADKAKGIEEHANSVMSDGIEKIVAEVFKNYTELKDRGRSNELRNAFRITLNRWANRIDQGYNLEVRIEPPEEKKKGDPIEEDINKIHGASRGLEFIKLEGPPILSLPESEEEKAPKKGDSKR